VPTARPERNPGVAGGPPTSQLNGTESDAARGRVSAWIAEKTADVSAQFIKFDLQSLEVLRLHAQFPMHLFDLSLNNAQYVEAVGGDVLNFL
jgi:hypothetical protein